MKRLFQPGAIQQIKSLSFILLLTGILLVSIAAAWGAEGIILKVVASPESNYCHLKFPAIRPETLYSNRPVLKDPSEGDIIDFYGPCDHDPLGKEEILRQRADLQRERMRPND
jgi:hypothetical protein